MNTLALTIVVPSYKRPDLLERCLEQLLPQLESVSGGAEILVVDDGSGEAGFAAQLSPHISVLRSGGVGPGRARNVGIGQARGEIVAFTDDDALVADNWVDQLMAAFAERPDALGIRGLVQSVDYDPLYEHSVEDATGGGYLTCNVAYRANALREVGGFDPAFSWTHEDRDLGYRIEQLGPVLFDHEIVITHPPRAFRLREWARRGRFVTDDWLLYTRYPAQRRGILPLRWAPVENIARRWIRYGRDGAVIKGSPRRFLRVLVLGISQGSVGIYYAATKPYRAIANAPVPRREFTPPFRIAYVGPVPNPQVGGAPGVAGLLFSELVARGATIDCFLPISVESDAADVVEQIPGVTVHRIDSKFAFGKWYSSHPLTKMISAQAATARGRARAAKLLRTRHRERPFDVLYQFSTVELFGLRDDGTLPPIVTHPSVHAAGELRWLKSERDLARRCQGFFRPLLVRFWVAARAKRQRRDISRATAVMAISEQFGAWLCADYGVDAAKVTVAENVIDVEAFSPPPGPRVPGPVRVVVLGRITVRKGLDDLVEATHLLRDLEGRLTIEVIGDHSLWSDYRPLLLDLNPAVARYVGHRHRDQVKVTLGQADVLVQASHYEPFGLTVAEALAEGVLVIATTAVGAAERLDRSVATICDAGNATALAEALRSLVARVERESEQDRSSRQQRCREAALERYTATVVGPIVDGVLRAAAAKANVAS